jgi:hypothetical protein
MKFTKEPPYGRGELACIVNSAIEVLDLRIPKLLVATSGEINKALTSIGFGYKPSFSVGDQGIQFVDMIEKMDLIEELKEKVLKVADQKLEHLKTYKKLI